MDTEVPTGLPQGFGNGWLTRNAHDLMQIAILFGGFDRDELIRRVVASGDPERMTNAGTVEGILGKMFDECEQECAA